jgi:hypothetical protein
VAAAESENGKCVGVGDVRLTRGAKRQRQLARLGLRSSWAGSRCALAGLAGCWLGREAEQAEAACEAFHSLSSFLFYFSFLFHYLNSNLV